MFRNLLTASTIACVLALGVPAGSAAAQNPLHKVGKATKEAGKGAVKGVKKAGDVTEDAAQKTAKETKNVGKTVEGAVTPDRKSVRCKDGTVQTGKTDADACRRHSGVKK
jgi:hypothetical protein